MKPLFLEPFYGGSHKDFADGLCRHSAHAIDMRILPARFWKWRMRGAALQFIRQIQNPGDYDVLLCSDLMSLADFKALCRGACPPAVVYFHENQLSYPIAPGETRDVHFGFTDITTALAAERVLFNSDTHRRQFFDHLPGFLAMMPDFRPTWAIEAIRSKTAVCYPGCRFPAGEPSIGGTSEGPPLVIWNHRWEFDKQPEIFFSAMETIAAQGIDFKLAVLGESHETVPEIFEAAKIRLKGKITHYGYIKDKVQYHQCLASGSVVVSTAIQENFGISIVEAVRFGCLPLVPDRLSYPEIIPEKAHAACLYHSYDELVAKLGHMLQAPRAHDRLRRELADAMGDYAWENRIAAFDHELEQIAARGGGSPEARARQPGESA